MRLWSNKNPIIDLMVTHEELDWINKNSKSPSGKTTYYENRSVTGGGGILSVILHFNPKSKRSMKKLDEILEKCKSHNKQ